MHNKYIYLFICLVPYIRGNISARVQYIRGICVCRRVFSPMHMSFGMESMRRGVEETVRACLQSRMSPCLSPSISRVLGVTPSAPNPFECNRHKNEIGGERGFFLR